MLRYIGRRVLTGLITICIVLVLNFLLIHLAPGDPIRILAGTDNPSPEMISALQAKYGLDKPFLVQLVNYVGNLAKGDFGTSIAYNLPVFDVIMERMGPSALLVLTSSILAFIFGTLLGLISARNNKKRFNRSLSSIAYFFYSMPPFWLGLMAILIFSSWLQILPTSGMVDMRTSYGGLGYFFDLLKHMVLPVGTLTIIQIPIYLWIFRSSVTQVMTEDFVTTFRAAGMSEKKIFRKYIFKNSILPTITVFGINLAYAVTGAALIEVVFAWPGTGRLMLDAIMRRDYPLLMGIYLLLSVAVAVMMIIIDLIYAWIDPRIRYKGTN